MTTLIFHDVYVESSGCAVGPLEAEGPLKDKFDVCSKDLYCGQNSFEKAEQQLALWAIDAALRKQRLTGDDMDLLIGGDLMNQLMSSHYTARHFSASFLGMYAACATSSLLIGQAAIWIQYGLAKRVLAFTSSHVAAAERQFRYPNAYGIQKKETTTSTVTGAGAMVISNKPAAIRVQAFTPGRIVDWHHTDANDMGLAMAPAVYDTLRQHLQDTGRTLADYDRILSGDLSKLGFAFLRDMLTQDGMKVGKQLGDCGMLIYDIDRQDVFCGGSGCACSMVVTIADVFKRMQQGEYRRVLLLASGALLAPIAMQQKDSVPCIAHAIVYERRDKE